LWQVIEMIAQVEDEQRKAAKTTTPATIQLSQLRGIGLTIASVLTNEVFFRDFQNRREVAGYLGLASSPWNSGAVNRDQGIQRSGNPRARRTAIELAWLWLRTNPRAILRAGFMSASSPARTCRGYRGRCHACRQGL
jgi:transposase